MNNLLLISSGLESIKEFVGRSPTSVRMVFIPTAGNPDEDVWWIDKDRDVLRKMGFEYSELDIAGKTLGELRDSLKDADVVYIAGGYTYYLLEQIRNTGFDRLLDAFIKSGGLYVGASAGALIVGPDIEPCSSIDSPSYGPSLTSSQGLGYTDIVPMPHYDMGERSSEIDSMVEKYKDRYQIVPITDDEAIVSDGNSWHKIESRRSSLEIDWFNQSH